MEFGPEQKSRDARGERREAVVLISGAQGGRREESGENKTKKRDERRLLIWGAVGGPKVVRAHRHGPMHTVS